MLSLSILRTFSSSLQLSILLNYIRQELKTFEFPLLVDSYRRLTVNSLEHLEDFHPLATSCFLHCVIISNGLSLRLIYRIIKNIYDFMIVRIFMISVLPPLVPEPPFFNKTSGCITVCSFTKLFIIRKLIFLLI